MELAWLDQRRHARRRLTRLLATEPIDAVEAALWVAAEDDGSCDPVVGRERLRALSAEAAARADGRGNPFARLDALREYLFDELGFRGNAEDYDDPRNSHLHEVLERRLGIPLTLSLVLMEAARAAGFGARGVALPGHFVTRLELGDRAIFVDAFAGGEVVTEEDCRQLVAKSTGRPSLFRRRLLDGATERVVVGRMLLNLKHVYLSRADYARALSVVERLLLVWPQDANEVRDRGFLKAHLGQSDAAIADLEAYLVAAPAAADAESVRGRVAWLRRRRARAT